MEDSNKRSYFLGLLTGCIIAAFILCLVLIVKVITGGPVGGGDSRAYAYGGTTLRTADDLAHLLIGMEPDAIERMTQDETFLAWLYSIGFGERVYPFFSM